MGFRGVKPFSFSSSEEEEELRIELGMGDLLVTFLFFKSWNLSERHIMWEGNSPLIHY